MEIFVPTELSGSYERAARDGTTEKKKNQDIYKNFAREFGFLGKVVATMNYPEDNIILEIGSLFGMSTITMALVAKHPIVAIDPHDGEWKTFGGERDRRAEVGNTLDRFVQNLEKYEVKDKVEIIQAYSYEVEWTDDRPICLLFLDGSHEYEDVKGDYEYFTQWLVPNGLVAFHDYGQTFKGVTQCVNEIVEAKEIEVLGIVGSMLIAMKS